MVQVFGLVKETFVFEVEDFLSFVHLPSKVSMFAAAQLAFN